MIKKRNKKIKTSEFFLELYERLFFPSAKAAALSCLLSARPAHKSLPRFLQKTSKVILNHARVNEGWPTKNAGDALAGVLGSIFLVRLFVSFLVSKMKIGYRLISLMDEEKAGKHFATIKYFSKNHLTPNDTSLKR